MAQVQAQSRRKWAVLGILLLAFLAYTPSLGNDFALDDSLARAANQGKPNPPIAELQSPAFYFTSDYWAGFGMRSGLYRPVTIYSFALTHVVFGGPLHADVVGHHLLNVLLNCWAAYLVWWLMLDFGMAFVGACLTAALFAVHGLHSEVVATVIGRGELFAFCFGMAGLQALRRGVGRRSGVWLAVAAVSFFLAFCSKESALAFVGFVPCYLAVRGELRTTWRATGAVLMPAAILFCVLRQMAVSGDIEPVKYAANPLCYAGLTERLVAGGGLWGYGLFLCFAPFSLASLYGPGIGAFVSFGLFVAAILPVWLIAALWRPLRRPGLFLSAALFFGFGFLTSNLPLAIGTVFGERLYFTPSLGVCMLPALLLPKFGVRGRRILLGVCAVWAVASVVVDVQRSLVWKDNETLLRRESAAPSAGALLQITAGKYFHVQEYEQPAWQSLFHKKAWVCARRAMELDPEYVDVYATQAAMLDRQGDHAAAIAMLRAALGLHRLPFSGLEANLRKDLGRLLITSGGQLAAGLQECRRSLELNPADLELRVRTIDSGRNALPPAVLGKLIDDGLSRYPGNVVLLTQKADYLFRHPARHAASTRVLVEILRRVFRSLPARKASATRFVIGRMQLGDGLMAIGAADAARQAYRVVRDMARAPAPIREQARQKLRALDR